MLTIEARAMFRSNGLIDDFVVYGTPEDYLHLAKQIALGVCTKEPVIIQTDSPISIEVRLDETQKELFTSLQNQDNEYLSMADWKARNILRVMGNHNTLENLRVFLVDLSTRGEGYSYLSEYSDHNHYLPASPEWRLHVELSG